MQRYAIFVDAGYLFAAGATALTGYDLPRYRIKLNQDAVIKRLKADAEASVNGASLLRIYWYDGLLPGGITSQQQSLAEAEDVKLRLGVVNAAGQQKGVDSLIVTDLVELARNRAISDAVALSGDEDVRVGVQIAQSYGVRVHLIGIEPLAHENNQSRALAQESDTTTEWSASAIGELMSISPGFDIADRSTEKTAASETGDDVDTVLDEVVAQFLQSLSSDDLNVISMLNVDDFIPRIYDAPLMARGKEAIGRYLNRDEQNYLRSRLITSARNAVDSPSD